VLKHRRRTALALAGAGAVLAVLAALTVRLFVVPGNGIPAHVDGIAMLDGPAGRSRIATTMRLAAQHRAPVVLVSRGRKYSEHSPCPRPPAEVRLVCFNPSPATTQGEAEFIGQFARQHHWRSVALVTIAPQATRARLRLSRCFSGTVYVVTAALPAGQWPYEIAYEWGAALKALFLQRSC
jgi:uncharacterized SAM-binding protein YcdF (DUF218 family)